MAGCVDASLVVRILDAHYVALAERFRVSLWTCDRRLADALGDGVTEVHLVPCGPS